MCKVVSVGLIQLHRLKIQLEVPVGKRDSVDSYLSVWLTAGREDRGLKPHPSHSALLCGEATLSSHMVVPSGLLAGPNPDPVL